MSSKSQLCITILGIVILAIGAIIILGVIVNPRKFVRVEATLVRLGSGRSDGSAEPIVEFETPQGTVRARCQDVGIGKFEGKVGDRVTVYYGARRTLGARTAVAYLEQDGKRASRYNLLVASAGALFAVAGAALVVLAKRFGA